MKTPLAILLAVILTGCATDPATMRLVLDAQAQKPPTLSVTCPAGGCSIQYRDPRDAPLKLPTNGWDVANTAIDRGTAMIGGAVVPAAMGYIAKEGFAAIRDVKSGDTTTTTTTVTTDSTHAPTVVPAGETLVVRPEIIPAADPLIVNPVVVRPEVVKGGGG